MTGPTPKRADSRSADAAAITQPSAAEHVRERRSRRPTARARASRTGSAPRSACGAGSATAPASHASASSVRLFQTSFRPSWISAVTDACGPACGTSLRRADPPQHQRRGEERQRVEHDRERRRQRAGSARRRVPGPTSADDVSPSAILAFASTSRLRPAICASSTWYAAPPTTFCTPQRKPTT